MHVLIHEINVNLHVRRESYENYILRNYWYFLFTHFRGDIHSPIGAGNTNKFKHCHFHPSAIFCGRWMFAHSYGFLLLLVVWCEKCNRSAARSVLILIGLGSRGLSTERSLCCKCENVGCSTYQKRLRKFKALFRCIISIHQCNEIESEARSWLIAPSTLVIVSCHTACICIKGVEWQ